MVLNEARTCELILRRNPHPNIAKYLGAYVEDQRITGLCFEKYEVTLAERLTNGPEISDSEHFLRGIEQGIKHLHGLRLVHNDINLYNIMITSDNQPVIINFDSCRFVGDPLGVKVGTQEWARPSATIAEEENDFYGPAKIAERMGIC
jgi:serine/threonine protein kinase